MKTDYKCMFQNFETDEFLVGIYDQIPRSVPLYTDAKTFTLQQGQEFLKDNAEILKDYELVACVTATKIFAVSQQTSEQVLQLKHQEDYAYARVRILNNILNEGQPRSMSDHQWSLLNIEACTLRSLINILGNEIRLELAENHDRMPST